MAHETHSEYKARLLGLVSEKQENLNLVVAEMCELVDKPHTPLNKLRHERLWDQYQSAEYALKYVQEKLRRCWSTEDGGDPYQVERLILTALEA